MRRFTITASVSVKIEVNDDDAIERVTGPGGDEWRSYAYPLRTRDDVFSHWVYNAVVNGVDRVNRLDGWADLADDAATFEVVDVEVSDFFPITEDT